MKPKILLVDDEPNVLESNKRILGREWSLKTASSGEDGLKEISTNGPFAVVVSDFDMPRMNGIQFLVKVRETAPESVRMMLTGEGDYQTAINAVNEGNIFRFLTKPCSAIDLNKALNAGVEQYELIQTEKLMRAQEVEIAAQIQRSLLLEDPPSQLEGIDIASITIPSQGADGDFLDFFTFHERCFDMIIGDVMGKGVSAALVGAGAKSRFSRVLSRLFSALGSRPTPEAIMRQAHLELNQQLQNLDRYLTLIYARFDGEARQLFLVDAGHPPVLHYSQRTGTVEELKQTNVPFGFPPLSPYCQLSVPLEEGDVFLFFSDGLIDSRHGKEFFGMDRLSPFLLQHKDLSASSLISTLHQSVSDFVAGTAFGDDLSIVVVKIIPDSKKTLF